MELTLKQARLLADLTQRQVAEKLGVHPQTYMKWEKTPDEIPVGKAKELSKILGREVDEIFFTRRSTKSRHESQGIA